MAVHQQSPSNLTELDMRGGMSKDPQIMKNMLDHSQEDSWLYWLKKGASTQY